MPDPRYRPRDYTSSPTLFGKTEGIEWPEPSDELRPRSEASQFQHRVMIQVTKHLGQRGGPSREVFADELGMSYDRLSRVLRGELVVQLDELMAITGAIGLVMGYRPKEINPR